MLAEWWALWSTCSKGSVGAVVVDEDFQVLASGFNGAPRGIKHCQDQDEPLVDADGHCLYCIHAEMNCGHQAARTGVSLRGGTLFTLTRPCIRCAMNMVQWGLDSVFYRDLYLGDPFHDRAIWLLRHSGVRVSRLEVTPAMAAHILSLDNLKNQTWKF